MAPYFTKYHICNEKLRMSIIYHKNSSDLPIKYWLTTEDLHTILSGENISCFYMTKSTYIKNYNGMNNYIESYDNLYNYIPYTNTKIVSKYKYCISLENNHYTHYENLDMK